MNIDYDCRLYRELVSFPIDEIVQVTNRKGWKTTIHITNLAKLTWHELQLLMPAGGDAFTKRVLLYRQYQSGPQSTDARPNNPSLTRQETEEINIYLAIFRDQGFSALSQLNKYITDLSMWGRFPTLRSLNDHAEFKGIPGIQPKYFEIVCGILGVSGEGGRRLNGFRKY
jgi:hypothetical protein